MQMTSLTEGEVLKMLGEETIPPPPGEGRGVMIRASAGALAAGWYGVSPVVNATLSSGAAPARTELAAYKADDLKEPQPGQYRINGFHVVGLEPGLVNIKLTFEDGLQISASAELR